MVSTNDSHSNMNGNGSNHNLDNERSHGHMDKSTLHNDNANRFNQDFKSSHHHDDTNESTNIETMKDQLLNNDNQKKSESIENYDGEDQNDDEMASIEERQIHDSLSAERENAYAKLQETLECVRATTKSMLNEIDAFLESTESVMIDYTKCQNSQRNEARRLEEVEPDVVGATEIYLAKIKGMMG